MGKNKHKQANPSGNQPDARFNGVKDASPENQNQGHNAKKEALGPNTNR